MFAAKPNNLILRIRYFSTTAVGAMAVIILLLLTISQPSHGTDIDVEIPVELDNEQRVKSLPIRVVDESGEPVAGVKIKPWALRSSQGHGTWREDPKERSRISPQEVFTDKNGKAEIAYPLYRNLSEKTLTTSVSIAVDHHEYAFETHHIDTPSLDNRDEIVLKQGASVLIKPLLDGKLASIENICVMTSGGRSWLSGPSREITDQGLIQLPVVEAGKVAIRVVRIVEEQATHFGQLLVLDLEQGEKAQHSVVLEPAITVNGRLTNNGSSLPFHDGRVKFATLHPSREFPDCTWFSWAPVDEDGHFTFSWPANESLEIIALSNDMIATPGKAPKVVEKVRDPDPFERAHVYSPEQLSKEIMLPMRPLVPCEVLVVDEKGTPLEGINVGACPNVQWWNSGSQIYCSPLVRAEQIIQTGDYFDNIDRISAEEFSQATDAEGYATLMLPEGSESLNAISKEYEMPISIGRRDIGVKLKVGETTKVKIVMQSKGQEQLGDWDKLAGVVFGCSTREGKRMCALPGVNEKVAEFRKLLQEADDPRDPKILVEAYSYIVEVLDKAGDTEEAAKWQRKVDKQKALLGS